MHDDVSELGPEACHGLVGWLDFYFKVRSLVCVGSVALADVCSIATAAVWLPTVLGSICCLESILLSVLFCDMRWSAACIPACLPRRPTHVWAGWWAASMMRVASPQQHWLRCAPRQRTARNSRCVLFGCEGGVTLLFIMMV